MSRAKKRRKYRMLVRRQKRTERFLRIANECQNKIRETIQNHIMFRAVLAGMEVLRVLKERLLDEK